MLGNDAHLGLTFATGPDGINASSKPTSSDESSPLVEPGSIATLRLNGRYASFAYVKAGAALAEGQIVSLGLNHDDADVDAAQTTSESVLVGTGDFSADEFNQMAGYVHIDAGGGLKFGAHAIRRNTANKLFTDENWGEALTTSSDFVAHMLNKVVLADADAVATKHVCGAAISALTSGNFGWIQISGVHRRVRSVGGTDPAVLGELVMASSTGGACKGWTAGGTTAEDVAFSFGMALAADAEADAAGEGIPVLLTHCLGFWI